MYRQCNALLLSVVGMLILLLAPLTMSVSVAMAGLVLSSPLSTPMASTSPPQAPIPQRIPLSGALSPSAAST